MTGAWRGSAGRGSRDRRPRRRRKGRGPWRRRGVSVGSEQRGREGPSEETWSEEFGGETGEGKRVDDGDC